MPEVSRFFGIVIDTTDDEMLPEYDFTSGVRGKHYEVMRKGYTVKIDQADGTTLIQHFTYEEGAASLNASHREIDYGCQGY